MSRGKVSVLFARFPQGNEECPDTADWLVQTVLKAKADERISNVHFDRVDDTPITMGRNRIAKVCLDRKIDLLCMLDSDMKFDLYPEGKPFWDTSLDFLLNHDGPCMVGAPYCGKPPFENVFVFRWNNFESDRPDPHMKLDQFTRSEAEFRMGIERVGALPTGLILIDTRCFRKMPAPWFYYEYTDKYETEKASTEDVTFTRDADFFGCKLYCNWDAWAGHWKQKLVGKPRGITADWVRDQFRHAAHLDRSANDRLTVLKRQEVAPRGGGAAVREATLEETMAFLGIKKNGSE